MWNEGYVSEIDYVFGYFPEMAPSRLRFALLAAGIGHGVGTSPDYLELGFGQGLSLAINAATTSGRYFGTDFNPSQAANAQRFGAASGKSPVIFDLSFEQLAARDDLPQFDIITMHGIWSWVSDRGRDGILRMIDERLKPGGILYMSYNVLPGWSPLLPLRELMWQHHQRASSGGMVNRIDQSIAFAERIRDLGTGYFGANPSVPAWLDYLKGKDRHYLAHEYFNAQWRPESFAQVAERLSTVKMDFAAPATILDTVAAQHMAPEVRAIVDEISDPILREFTKDVLINQQFRADIFVKGARKLTPNEVTDAMCDLTFVRTGLVPKAPESLNTRWGRIPLNPEIFQPITQAFDAADDVAAFVDVAQMVAPTGMSDSQLVQSIITLVGTGYLSLATQSDTLADDYYACLRFNRDVCRQARYSASVGFLAAPGIGEGVAVGRIPMLIIHAIASDYEDIADYVLETLSRQNEGVMGPDGPITDAEAARALIEETIAEVRTVLLPQLERIGAVASATDHPFAVPTADLAAMDPDLMRLYESEQQQVG